MKHLLEYNASIPYSRSAALEKYAIAHSHVITAKLISDQRESSTKINPSMSEQYISFRFNKALEMNEEIEYGQYLIVCLQKKMIKMVKLLINKHNTPCTIAMLLEYCIPPKEDSPEAEIYLNLAKVLLSAYPDMIKETNENGESALYKACESGNLPHVQYFISLDNELIDMPNNNGDTPLYISCVKCWPCIIRELIKNKADINAANKDGNTPIFAACNSDRPRACGNPKFAEILLATNRVKMNVVNKEGDSLIIHCCRLGHKKILELLLNYIEDKDFVCNHKSKLSGFNALFTCFDSTRFNSNNADQIMHGECIRMLHEYGVDLNQKLDNDHSVIPGGTPLHLAVYYNQKDSVNTL